MVSYMVLDLIERSMISYSGLYDIERSVISYKVWFLKAILGTDFLTKNVTIFPVTPSVMPCNFVCNL